MARPKLQIDPEQVKSLAAIGCTSKEIAAALKCGYRTIETRFCGAMDEGRALGRQKLRHLQWQAAAKGHWPALEYLGKIYLGQRATPEVEVNVTIQSPEAILKELKDVTRQLEAELETKANGNAPPPLQIAPIES